jgi:hypothetical protein
MKRGGVWRHEVTFHVKKRDMEWTIRIIQSIEESITGPELTFWESNSKSNKWSCVAIAKIR